MRKIKMIMRKYEAVLELVGDILAALLVFAFLYFLYIFLWILEIGC